MRSLNERIKRLQERGRWGGIVSWTADDARQRGHFARAADHVVPGMRPQNGPDRRNGCSVGRQNSSARPARAPCIPAVRVAGADNRRDRNRPAATRVVARLIVVGGLVPALSACSATRAIDIICPPTGQCPNTLSGHGGGYLSGRGRECDPRGAINSARLGAGRRVVDDIWRLIWLGYRDRSRRILVRRESGRGRVAAALER
jgi:hypothetical protein